MLFLRVVLDDIENRCCISTSLDYKTIEARVKHEGLSFLTITLPSFGKDFEKSLDLGFVAPNLFKGFSRRGAIPEFLGGLLESVFDRTSGVLLPVEGTAEVIRAVRQITLMFGKMALPCSDERRDAAFAAYMQCELDVRDSDRKLDRSSTEDYQRIGALLFREMYTELDLAVYQGSILPKHGPGSTAEKLLGNKKYNQREWTQRLETYFPSGSFLFSSWSFFLENADCLVIHEPGAERPVRVVDVPKTLKTPRIIALEPTCMQYVQQGLLEQIVEGIQRNYSLRTFISWEFQQPNQLLAQKGSSDGTLATLDLSEASDRVSNQHVRLLLANHPHLMGAVDACRSRKADVPNHGVIRLAKFASMGSALCFPFESMVFLTLIFLGIERALNTRLTGKLIKSFHGKVRVYGDDIIVPVEFVHSVIQTLEAFGLKVNGNKSFWTGKFRESCGKEYYNGRDVSITRVRRKFPTSRKHTAELISTVSLRNQLFVGGYDGAVELLDSWIERLIPFPVTEPTSSLLGKWSYEPYKAQRMHPYLHVPLVKGVEVTYSLPKSFLDGSGALMKWFLKRDDLPFIDENHLQYAGRPVSVDIKTRWRKPY